LDSLNPSEKMQQGIKTEWEGMKMGEKVEYVLSVVQMSGILAPIIFIIFHTLRQFFFIPVIVVCFAGGLLFGAVFGAIYSLIGLTLSSFVVYFLLRIFPSFHQKIQQFKMKWFGPYANLTTAQISVLKLVPFMYYQLLCFCLMERKKAFHEYAIASFYTNIPVVIFYTVFGQFFKHFSPTMGIVFIISLMVLIIAFREKFVVIKWKDFFKATS
jgi:uncharacterized membrane protein YdjX (TVP38/TMEM64 family)